MTTLYFILFSVGIGVSLSIDVFFVTLTRLQTKSIVFWALWVAFLHTIFPYTSFTVGWSIGQFGNEAKIVVGLFGFTLVSLFLYEEFCEKIGVSAKIQLVEGIKNLLGVSHEKAGILILGTGVSIDSLLFGLTFVATKNAEGWNTLETYLVITISGITVFVVTMATPYILLFFVFLAKKLGLQLASEMATTHFWADLAVFSVIGGFAVLPLKSIFGDASVLYSILISIMFWSLLFYHFRNRLMQSECEEAAEIIR